MLETLLGDLVDALFPYLNPSSNHRQRIIDAMVASDAWRVDGGQLVYSARRLFFQPGVLATGSATEITVAGITFTIETECR